MLMLHKGCRRVVRADLADIPVPEASGRHLPVPHHVLADTVVATAEDLDVRRYSQRRVDVIDLKANHLVSSDFASVAGKASDLPLDMFASRDSDLERRMAERGRGGVFSWVLTFDRLLGDTDFVGDMKQMLHILQEAYDYPVDTEFTTNFSPDGAYRINLVQCRPLQIRGGGGIVEPPEVDKDNLVLEARGAVIGQSRVETIDRLVYVVPSVYGELPLQQRYSVARLIGRLMRLDDTKGGKLMLLGPGRWGTTTPSLGVPVNFAEISPASVLCEIVAMRDGLVPDVSLGTHFFNNLVEMDMLYVALFPGKEGNLLNHVFLEGARNRLTDLLPGEDALADAVRVVDVTDIPGRAILTLNANALTQRVVCYVARGGGA